jgi:hypothetical protein
MKINSELGYKPVTFSELTTDEKFWKGCQSCSNYDILMRTERKMCLCTGMVCAPQNNGKQVEKTKSSQSWEQFKKFLSQHKKVLLPKKNLFLKSIKF